MAAMATTGLTKFKEYSISAVIESVMNYNIKIILKIFFNL